MTNTSGPVAVARGVGTAPGWSARVLEKEARRRRGLDEGDASSYLPRARYGPECSVNVMKSRVQSPSGGPPQRRRKPRACMDSSPVTRRIVGCAQSRKRRRAAAYVVKLRGRWRSPCSCEPFLSFASFDPFPSRLDCPSQRMDISPGRRLCLHRRVHRLTIPSILPLARSTPTSSSQEKIPRVQRRRGISNGSLFADCSSRSSRIRH